MEMTKKEILSGLTDLKSYPTPVAIVTRYELQEKVRGRGDNFRINEKGGLLQLHKLELGALKTVLHRKIKVYKLNHGQTLAYRMSLGSSFQL
jgi:hypothetical protein